MMHAITGPTEFIISIVNSVKMATELTVVMPMAWLPHRKNRKSLCMFIIIIIIIINFEFAIYIMSTPTKYIVDDSKLVIFVTR